MIVNFGWTFWAISSENLIKIRFLKNYFSKIRIFLNSTSFDLKWPQVKLKVSIRVDIMRASKWLILMTHHCMSHPVGHFQTKFSIWPHLTPTWPWVIKRVLHTSQMNTLSDVFNRISLLLSLTPEKKSTVLDFRLENFVFFVISRIWNFFFIIIVPYALSDGGIRFPVCVKKSFGVSLIIESPQYVIEDPNTILEKKT